MIGIYGYAAYCASKFALHGFADALRSEAKPHGVTISVCFPPDTETPQFARELEHRPLEATVIMGRVAPWPSSAVALRIVRAIDKGQFEVFFGWTLWALGRFGRDGQAGSQLVVRPGHSTDDTKALNMRACLYPPPIGFNCPFVAAMHDASVTDERSKVFVWR